MASVADELMELAGGNPFAAVRRRSELHQLEHGCRLHNAGGPQMQLVSALARTANVKKIVDLGCGLGYSTLWLAHATGSTGSVVGIDDDPAHIDEAESIAADFGLGDRVSYVTGRASDVLATLTGPVDMIHDDAWFATAPDHLDAMVDLLRPGGLLTMANWFLLVDALTGDQRNDWAVFAGDDWAQQTLANAQQLADRTDLAVTWSTNPPIGFATKSIE